jgi:predicted transcriptional regulator
MPEEAPSASINRELAAKIAAAYVRQNQIGSDQLGEIDLDRSSGNLGAW